MRLYPFNAADALTLLNEKAPAPHKKGRNQEVRQSTAGAGRLACSSDETEH